MSAVCCDVARDDLCVAARYEPGIAGMHVASRIEHGIHVAYAQTNTNLL